MKSLSTRPTLNHIESSPNRRGKDSFPKACAFLLGLLSTMGCVYVLMVGNTAVTAAFAFAPIALCVLIVGACSWPHVMRASVDVSVIAYFAIACLSIVMTVFYVATGTLNEEAIAVPFKGFAVFICCIAVYCLAVVLIGYKAWIYAGLAFGMLLAFVFCLLSQLAFVRGSWFSLCTIFPQDGFVVSVPWESRLTVPVGDNVAGTIYSFRPQGLFLECSHLMIFLVALAPLVIYSIKNVLLRIVLIAFCLYSCVFSQSPDAIIFLVEIVLILMYLRKRNGARRMRNVRLDGAAIIVMLMACLLSVVLLTLNPWIIDEAVRLLNTAFGDFNVATSTDGGTRERWRLMQAGSQILGIFPLGVGWNLETFIMNMFYGSESASSHTLILKLLIEVGPIGLVCYFFVIYRHAAPLLAKGVPSDLALIGVAVLAMALCQFTNGVSLAPWMWLLLGLARGAAATVRNDASSGSSQTRYTK